jgi:serine/threonine protein kinase/maltose-binding protein MalE
MDVNAFLHDLERHSMGAFRRWLRRVTRNVRKSLKDRGFGKLMTDHTHLDDAELKRWMEADTGSPSDAELMRRVDECVNKCDECRRRVERILKEKAASLLPSLAPVTSDRAPATDPWPVGHEPILGYRLHEKIGQGGLGEVWKAIGPGGHPVALKRVRLNDPYAPLELRAMETIKKITNHPHLLSIHGTWQTGDDLVIVMAFADGGSLEGRVFLSPRDASFVKLLEYMKDAAAGLDYLHQGGRPEGKAESPILHRDIKPANLMLVGDRVQVGDFSLLKELQKQQTQTGAHTSGYEPPEYHEQGLWTARSDQFSLAKTYLVLRTGKAPHNLGPSTLTDAEERRIVEKALAHNRKDRFPSCGKFARALDEWHRRRYRHPSPGPIWLAAACLLLAALALIPLARLGPKPLPPRPPVAVAPEGRGAIGGPAKTRALPTIAVTSGTRGPIARVIKKYIHNKKFKKFVICEFNNNEDALDAYRAGKVDIMMVDDIWVPELAEKGLLLDLAEVPAFQRDFGRGGLEAHFEGPLRDVCHYPPGETRRTYGLPFLANVQMLMYNYDILERYGLQLPRDPEGLRAILEEAAQKLGRPVFAIRSKTGNQISEVFWQLLNAQGTGAYLDKDRKTVVIRRDEGQRALDWLFSLKKKNLILPTTLTLGTDEIKTQIFRENLFMAFGWPGWVTSGYDELNQRGGTSKRISMHLLDGSPTLGAWLLAIRKGSEYRDEAYLIIKDLCTDGEIQQEFWKAGSFPADKQVDGTAVMQAELDTQGRDGRREFYTHGIDQIRMGLAVARPRPRTPHWAERNGIEDGLYKRLENFMERDTEPDITDLFRDLPWLRVQ